MEGRNQEIPYNYLVKRAVKFSIETAIIFILIFYWEEIIFLFRIIFRF